MWAGDIPDPVNRNTYTPVITECSSLLLTYDQKIALIRAELNKIVTGTESFVDRQALRLLKRPIRSRVLVKCQASGACTTTEFIQATHEVVEHMFSKGHKVRTYSKLIAINIGVAAATAFLTNKLPRDVQAITTFIMVYVSNAAWEFVAPIAEPSLGKLRQRVFSSVHRKKTQEPQTDHNKTYSDVWQATQANLTPPAQWGRSTINSFLAVALPRTYAAHQAMMLYPDPIKARSYAADQIAEVLFYLRTAFKDIPPTEVDIVRGIRSSFVDHIENPQSLIPEIMAKLQTRDPYFKTATSADYYDKALESWFGNLR